MSAGPDKWEAAVMSVLRKGRHGRSTRQGPRRRNLVPKTRHGDGAGLSGQCAPAARAGSAAGLPHEEVRGREEPRRLREALGEQPRDEERSSTPSAVISPTARAGPLVPGAGPNACDAQTLQGSPLTDEATEAQDHGPRAAGPGFKFRL